MNDEVKETWDITDLMYVTSRVVFSQPVSQEEALRLWTKGVYEDILDNFDGDIFDIAVRIE